MIVECINNSKKEEYLTDGKDYVVLKETSYLYLIKDDSNKEQFHCKFRFIDKEIIKK